MYSALRTCTETLDLPNIMAALFDRNLARGGDRDMRSAEDPNFYIYVWCDTASAEPPVEKTAAETAVVVELKGKDGCHKPAHSNPRVSQLHN